ncbi:unnamed protein product, partial [Porites evermanni]
MWLLLKPLQHPHFGGKQPKKHILPRCLNVACKEEKDEKIKKLTEEVQHLKDEVPGSVLPPCKGQGKMSREEATTLGLTELVSGSGVWICPNKLGAAIKDTENKSRTVLVWSLLCRFYDKEELLSKNFSDLDKEITEAAIDFAMVARLGEVKNVGKADLRQALRHKLNSMKSPCSKPEYFQGK